MSDKNSPEKAATQQGIPWFNLRSDPYHIPDELARSLARIVMEWGRMENALATDISSMMSLAPNVRALSPEVPRAFKRKIELWKRCVHTLFPTVDAYKNTASEICQKGKSIAQIRHDLIHGGWEWPDSDSDQDRSFKVMNVRGKQIVQYDVDAAFVAGVHRDLLTVSEAILSFTITRMLHGHLGILKVVPSPEP